MGAPNTGQILIGTSPTPIVSNPGGCLTIINLSNTDIYLGGSGVSTSSGILLPGTKGATLKLETCDDWYGIVALGTARVAFIVGTPAGLFFLGGGGGASISKQVTTLTAAQVTNLTTVFIPITETPAAGFRIVPIALSVEYKFGGTDYGATGTFSFFWGATPGANFAYRVLNGNGFLNPGDGINRYAQCMGVSEADSGVSISDTLANGQPVNVGNAAAAFNTGNGNVIITAYYTVEPIA